MGRRARAERRKARRDHLAGVLAALRFPTLAGTLPGYPPHDVDAARWAAGFDAVLDAGDDLGVLIHCAVDAGSPTECCGIWPSELPEPRLFARLPCDRCTCTGPPEHRPSAALPAYYTWGSM